MSGRDADNNRVDYGGTFTDAVIDGNGTYTVGVTPGEMAPGTDQALRMASIRAGLFMQTSSVQSDLPVVFKIELA